MERHWEAAEVEQVADGVFRLPLPLPHDGLRVVNVYALVGGDGVTLIDGGWDTDASAAALDARLSDLGLSVLDVASVHVTHAHRDHYTQAITLRRRTRATVSLGKGERANLAVLQSGPRARFKPQIEQLRRFGATRTALAVSDAFAGMTSGGRHWDDPDLWTEDLEVIQTPERTLRVVATPGHTRGHVIFHDECAGVLFSGDHVLPHITPSIGFEPAPSISPLSTFLESLARVRSRPDARMLPAHGPVRDSVHERIDELVQHHEDRLDAIHKRVVGGATLAEEVAESLPWTRHARRLGDLDPFNRMLAVLETGAHLDVLVAQDRIRTHQLDEVVHFEP